MEQLQGLDAAFVALEQPKAPVHIGSIIIYDPSTAPDGFVRFKDILSFIKDRMQLSKTLRQKMVKVPFGIDYPYWVQDADFDLEYHVRHVALPKPGDWRQLCILGARIFARPLDMSRPPWEITVIEGLDNIKGFPKGSYAMLSKVHHAAIDGVSGIDLMQATHTLYPTRDPLDTPDTWRPESNPSQIETFVRGSMRSMTLPLRQMNASRKLLPGMYRATKGLIKRDFNLKPLLETPKTRFNGTVSPHRMYGANTFDIKDIIALRTLAEGSKINDVMLSITGGALRHYLAVKDEVPATSMTAMAPISVRDEKEKNTMGNQVSAMFVPLGSHIEQAHERLKYVFEETGKAKAFTEALGARQMTEMAKLTPAVAMNIGASLFTKFKLADAAKPFINTVVTNVPGPRIPLYSAGAKAVGVYGMMCLVDGIRLGHIVQSYMDEITLSYTACREAMPDPDFYNECVQRSFEDHMTALKLIKTRQAAQKTTKTVSVKKTKKPAPKKSKSINGSAKPKTDHSA